MRNLPVKKGFVSEPIYETYTIRILTPFGCTFFCANDIRHRVRHRIRYRIHMNVYKYLIYMNENLIRTVYDRRTVHIYVYGAKCGAETIYDRYMVNIYMNNVRCRIRCRTRFRIVRAKDAISVYGSYKFCLTRFVYGAFFTTVDLLLKKILNIDKKGFDPHFK